MQVKTYTVYRHIFPNGKSYIGITCLTPYTRRWGAGSGYKNQPKMYRAIMKYGWDNILHEVISSDLSLLEANSMEQEMISYFDSIHNGYNISSGGGGSYGIPCSESKKLKISRANKGKPNPYGAKNLQAYREANGAWNKGGHLTEEQYFKIATERKTRCSKKITAFDPKTMNVWMRFPSVTSAAHYVGVSKENISRCALGKRKTAAGFIWRYDNDRE